MTEINKVLLKIIVLIFAIFIVATWDRFTEIDLDLNLNTPVEIVSFNEGYCHVRRSSSGRYIEDVRVNVFYWYKFNNLVYGSIGINYDLRGASPGFNSVEFCEKYLLELKKLKYAWIDPKKPTAAFLINDPVDFSGEIFTLSCIGFLFAIFLLNLFLNRVKK